MVYWYPLCSSPIDSSVLLGCCSLLGFLLPTSYRYTLFRFPLLCPSAICRPTGLSLRSRSTNRLGLATVQHEKQRESVLCLAGSVSAGRSIGLFCLAVSRALRRCLWRCLSLAAIRPTIRIRRLAGAAQLVDGGLVSLVSPRCRLPGSTDGQTREPSSHLSRLCSTSCT